ncbi:pseudouridine-5'-phosphate glycosidase [Citreimonas salinaria]|uniref:pseudouridine-5'-phosphate glycosidase n=1 Tax=Citreimonas salinaria TaxID=321339 RepID=UPI003CCBB843
MACSAGSWSPTRYRPRPSSRARRWRRLWRQPTTTRSNTASYGITGKDLAPYLLQRIYEKTEGRSLEANVALVLNNARLAAQIARALSSL